MTIVTLVSGCGNAYRGDGTRDGGGQGEHTRDSYMSCSMSRSAGRSCDCVRHSKLMVTTLRPCGSQFATSMRPMSRLLHCRPSSDS